MGLVLSFTEKKRKRETNKTAMEKINKTFTMPDLLDSFDQQNLPVFLADFLKDLKEKVTQYAIVYVDPVGELRYTWRSPGTKELVNLLSSLQKIIQTKNKEGV